MTRCSAFHFRASWLSSSSSSSTSGRWYCCLASTARDSASKALVTRNVCKRCLQRLSRWLLRRHSRNLNTHWIGAKCKPASYRTTERCTADISRKTWQLSKLTHICVFCWVTSDSAWPGGLPAKDEQQLCFQIGPEGSTLQQGN